MDNKAFYKLTYGLYVLSSQLGGKHAACVVNTAAQVTAEPPMLAVTVAKKNFTHGVIEKSGVFAVSVLTQDATIEFFGTFGFKTSGEVDKFTDFGFALDGFGVKYLTEYSAAHFSCKVKKSIDLGTHTMFIGEATEGEVSGEVAEPITYSYYQAVKRGGTPVNAPSYQMPRISRPAGEEVAMENAKKYECQVCGYVYDEAEQGARWEDLPDDYTCPMCGAGKEMFEEA